MSEMFMCASSAGEEESKKRRGNEVRMIFEMVVCEEMNVPSLR